MTEQLRVGSQEHLDGEFRVGTVLTDPTSPSVALKRPNGTTYITATPAKLLTGVFRASFIIPDTEPTGIWTVVWTGTLGGSPVSFTDIFEVVAADAEIRQPTTERIRVGQAERLDGEFRVGTTLTDPANPTVTMIRPNGSQYGEFIPVKLVTGVYRHSFVLAESETTGMWRAQWDGDLDGTPISVTSTFEVLGGAGAATVYVYGTSVEGLQAYLPWLPISIDSQPSRAHVVQFLDEIGSEVSLRIGDVERTLESKPPVLSRVLRHARHVVYLGAAALAQDATNPERSEIGGDGYATVTWQRYQTALDKLEAIVDAATPGDTPGAGADLNVPEIESGPPMFSTQMPF